MTLLSSRMAVWALFIVPAAGIAVYSIPQYVTLDPARSAIPLNVAVPSHLLRISIHAIPASLALLIGPIQPIPGVRAQYPAWHRILGRIYAGDGAGAIAAATGVVIALFSASGIPAQVAFVILSLIWGFALWTGFTAARARRIAAHRLWMIRNVALTYTAVLLRLFLGLGAILMERWPSLEFGEVYTASIWAAVLVVILASDWVFAVPAAERRR